MPVRPHHIAIALALLLCASSAWAEQIIRLEDVRPGMRGHGMTVFRGTTPERFDVEVVDVLHQFLTRQDLILIRMDHPVLERSGTIGGMSGSPIYLDGRLAGALAYGWYYAMDPIAGVTPIESMLEELDRPLRPPPPLGRPLRARPRARARLAAPEGAPLSTSSLMGPLPAYWERFRQTDGPTPALTPLLLGGFSARARALLGELLGDVGMVPVEAGGGGGRRSLPRATGRPFVPGGAIGVQLVRGDLTATGIGTVTTVRGRNVLAFGHPMLNFGQQHFPVVTARILTVLASRRRSFKIGEPLAEAGALTQDRQPCIIADTEATSPMTPIEVRLNDRTTGRRDRFELEVVRDRFLLPALGLSSVAAVLDRFASDRADLTVWMRGTLDVSGHGSLTLTDHAFTERGAADAGTLLDMRPLRAVRTIVRNDFERVEIERLTLDVTLDYRREEAEIIGAYVTTEEPEAGTRVSVHVVLRPFAGPEEVRLIPVTIPRAAAGQRIQIEVTGGDDARPPRPHPQGLDDVLRNLGRTFPATSLVVTLTRQSSGVSVRGHVAEQLPPSALDALRPVAQDSFVQPLRTTLQVASPAGRVIHGRARIGLTAREPGV